MSFATARNGLATPTEKQFHRLPAAGPSCDVMEMDMEFQCDPRTTVEINGNQQIAICQPDERCFNCGADETAYVYFSASRAREVASELLRLADQIDAREPQPRGG